MSSPSASDGPASRAPSGPTGPTAPGGSTGPTGSIEPSGPTTADAYDAVVLAGGQARRFGADKLAADLAGARLLDHTLLALAGLGTPSPPRHVVVVGPTRPVPAAVSRVVPVDWCREEPPGGGPLAAVGATANLLEAPWVVIVAGDMPLVAHAVPALLTAAQAPHDPPWQAAVLVSADGRVQPLACVLRRDALTTQLARLHPLADRPARALLTDLRVARVAEPAGTAWSADVDRPEDLIAARPLVARSASATPAPPAAAAEPSPTRRA